MVDGVDEDFVGADEDARAELDGEGGGVVGGDGRAASADVGVAVEDGDVEGEAGVVGVLGEVVGRGRACCSGS